MRNCCTTRILRARFLAGAGVGALLASVALPAQAQVATSDTTPQSTQDATVPTNGATAKDQPNPQAPGIQAAPVDQVPGPEGENDVIVQGIRENLESALSRKRNADTVVDSITADNIGSFPDKSVAEALERVPGVTVSRFAGATDTSHFSAEPSGLIIRGLPQVRSEFNGRDTFSANSSRGLDYADISPELLAGVDVYKNETAEMIEGGIAGTINLRTRLPFDTKGRLFSVSGNISYNDLAKQGTPAVSAIFSDRFQTGIGEFGLLLNGAYSEVKTASQGIQLDREGIFSGVFGSGTQYIPSGVYMRDNQYDRKRYGVSAAAQWESNDGSLSATLQFNRSQYDNKWREHAIYSSAFSVYGFPTDSVITDPSFVTPLTGKPDFTFDSDGNFLTGWWSAPRPYVGEGDANKGYGVNSSGQAFFNRCYTWEGCVPQRRAPQLDTMANALHNREWTQDIGGNVDWKVTDRLNVRFDGQYVTSEVHNYNASVDARTYIDTFVDLSGKYPSLTFAPTAENINLSPGGLTNPNNYSYYSITDHTEDSRGHEVALRADADYDFDSDWLSALRMGVRYADRDQDVRWGAYNWANISNTWTATQASYFNLDRPVYPAGNYEIYNFPSNFFGGNQMNQNTFVFFNMDKLASREQLAAALGRPSIGVGDYYPVCSNQGYRAGETITDDFGCYLPSEELKINERTWAGYAMLKFGGDRARIGGVGVSGNIGARLVWTRDATSGAVTFATPFTPNELTCTIGKDPNDPTKSTYTSGCVTSAQEIAFNNGAAVPTHVSADHFDALPSFNLKLDFTSKFLARFAYSRAISRPDVGLLRNYITISRVSPDLTNLSNPNIIFDANGVPVGYHFQYMAKAGNPNLRPISANQFDLTLEYYFSRTSSVSLDLFRKDFSNYIQNGTYNLSLTNNGVTRTVLVQQPLNGEGAAIQGLEAAFQTFFNFLPAPFDGLGIQANYTYVDNKGVKSSNLVAETGGITSGGGLTIDTTAVVPNALEGVSKHTFNIIGMYEKGPLSIRAAYNWRSRYLITALDCCIGLPIWQDSAGFLDGSIRFAVTKQFEINLEGSNLLGTTTHLFQQVDNQGTLKDNAFFKNDRRFQIGVRYTM